VHAVAKADPMTERMSWQKRMHNRPSTVQDQG